MAGLQKKTIENIIGNKVKFWVWSMNDIEKLSTAIGRIGQTDYVKHYFPDWENVKNNDEKRKDIMRNWHGWMQKAVVVTGGCIASMLLGEEVNDYDMYFSAREDAEFVAHYYLAGMKLGENSKVPTIEIRANNTNGVTIFIKSQGVLGDEDFEGQTTDYSYFEALAQNEADKFLSKILRKEAQKEDTEKNKYKVQFMTSNAITLHDGVQLILRFCGNPKEIHDNYDFVHATNYWTKHTGVVYNEHALRAILERRLYYVGSKFPICSMFRTKKFIRRGFAISAGEMMKIMYDAGKLNLNDPNVLHDQLLGVDFAYFWEVINLLREGVKAGRELDRSYLFEIINNVFQEGHEDNPNHQDGEVESNDQISFD